MLRVGVTVVYYMLVSGKLDKFPNCCWTRFFLPTQKSYQHFSLSLSIAFSLFSGRSSIKKTGFENIFISVCLESKIDIVITKTYLMSTSNGLNVLKKAFLWKRWIIFTASVLWLVFFPFFFIFINRGAKSLSKTMRISWISVTCSFFFRLKWRV